MIKIAHAVYDESGKSVGGRPGDQNTKEVCIWDWYKSGTGWTHIIRAKDKKVASKIAKVAISITDNNHVGYNQNKRLTLFEQAQTVSFDMSKITVDCETDCSAMVSVCINAVGIKIPKDIYTGNQINAIKATGAFEILSDKKYLTSADNLQEGDILFRTGHTAIAVDVKRKLQLTSPYMKGEDVKELQSLIDVTTDGVYGPGTDKKVQSILSALGR
jgi:hypothetical protein